MKTILSGGALAFLLSAGCTHVATYDLFQEGTTPREVASIQIPAEIGVRSVNGEKPPAYMAWNTARTFTLRVAAGPQTWEVRYYDPFVCDDQTVGQNAVDRSNYMPLTFVAEAGQTYTLRYETSMENSALQYTKERVRIWAEDEKRNEIGAATAPAPKKKAAKPEPTPAPVPAATSSPAPASAPAAPTTEQAALDQLKKWWPIAGPRERAEFLKWTQQQ